MPTKKEILDALKNAQGELRRSGSSILRALADSADEKDTDAKSDNQATDPSGAPVQFDGVANPEPPKVLPNTEDTPVPAIDTVDPESDEDREKRNTTFPAPTTNPDVQNPAEYEKMYALPSSEVNEANYADPVTGPLPANPEPAKPGPNEEESDEEYVSALASEPEVDEKVDEAPESKEHTSASVPTTEEVAEAATTGEDPGLGKGTVKTDEDTAAGIYEGSPNVQAAEAGFPGATEEAKEKNEAILNEGTDVTTGGTPTDTKPADQEADDTDEA